MPEGEADRQLARLVPAVPDKDALAVTYLARLAREPAERRRVLDALRQGHGEATPGLSVADQYVDQGVGQLLASEPALDERRGPSGEGDGDRRACVQDHDRPGVGLEHPLDQFLLLAGQVHARAVVALALPIVVGAYDDDGHIGCRGRSRPPPRSMPVRPAPVPASSFSRASRHPGAKATSTSGPRRRPSASSSDRS